MKSANELQLTKETLQQLNPLAFPHTHTSVRGVVPIASVLGAAGDDRVAKLDEEVWNTDGM